MKNFISPSSYCSTKISKVWHWHRRHGSSHFGKSAAVGTNWCVSSLVLVYSVPYFCHVFLCETFLGAFENLRKTTTSLIIYVPQCEWNNSGHTRRLCVIFCEKFYWNLSKKLKYVKNRIINIRHFTRNRKDDYGNNTLSYS